MRRSSSFSSGQSAHSSGGSTGAFGIPQSILSREVRSSGPPRPALRSWLSRFTDLTRCVIPVVLIPSYQHDLSPAAAGRRLAYESCLSFCAGGCAVRRRARGLGAQQPAAAPKDPQAAEARAEAGAEAGAEARAEARRAAEVRGDRRRLRVAHRREADQRAGDDDGHRRRDASRARRPRTSPSCCAPCPASTSPRCPRATSTSPRAARPARSSTGTLALLDGRSLYQDFFGFVMWDFLPVNLNEIKQVEVIRGPASAVWGANALNGVVNVITKSPREMQGTSAVLGVGGFDRAAGQHRRQRRAPARSSTSAARTRRRSTTASRSRSRPAATRRIRTRGPTGTIPVRPRRGLRRRAQGLSRLHQPGHDAAEVRRARRLRLPGRPEAGRSRAASPAPTASCTPASGPSTSTAGSVMGYGKVNFTRKGFRAGFFTQHPERRRGQPAHDRTDGQADRLRLPDARPSTSKRRTCHGQGKHVVHLRRQPALQRVRPVARAATRRTAPRAAATSRTRSSCRQMFRLVAGARVDRFDYLDNFVFSPRVTFMVKPQDNHTIRVSYNRAYRSPSVINNFLDITIAEPLEPRRSSRRCWPGRIYPIPIHVGRQHRPDGDARSTPTRSATAASSPNGRAIISAAFYVNKREGRHLLHRADQPALDGDQPAAPAGRCRRR